MSGAVYNLSKPLYKAEDFVASLQRSLDTICSWPKETTFLLAGDFNHLNNDTIISLGLTPVFCGPTHQGHCLDRLYSSHVLNYQCRTVISTVLTGHRAVIAWEGADAFHDTNKKRTVIQYHKHTPSQHPAFLAHFITLFMGRSNAPGRYSIGF